MIGPTGVGKTEIARRLARLAGSPFVKVEASKFTEVGYVGRDVESMIRDLVDTAVSLVRTAREDEVESEAAEMAEERLLALLLPEPPSRPAPADAPPDDPRRMNARERLLRQVFGGDAGEREDPVDQSQEARFDRTREKLRKLLRDGKLEKRMVEVTVRQGPVVGGMMLPMGGMEGMDLNLTEMLQDMLPKRSKVRSVTVAEARRILLQEEMEHLIDMDEVINEALDRAEDMGIIFLDELDKIAGGKGGAGPDVSRQGVQRDLLPIVEGCNVQTKYGFIRTDHILFIAAGAFHVAKPTDLIPELQGRFPIRVELQSLDAPEFERILKEPRNALVRQYQALIEADGAAVEFSDEGIAEIARIAAELNDRLENIGARRLGTVVTTLLEEILFDLPDQGQGDTFVVTPEFVRERLEGIAASDDLSRYIL